MSCFFVVHMIVTMVIMVFLWMTILHMTHSLVLALIVLFVEMVNVIRQGVKFL